MVKTTQQRRNEIYCIIVSKGSACVSELAGQLQVTIETICKDFNSMDEQDIIIKNYGGAEIKNTYYQLPLDVKMSEHVYEKQLIVRRALDLVRDNTVLFLDPSSTTLHLVKYLRLCKGLIVVTNSPAIASMVSETTHQLMIAGGLLQKQGKAAIGGFTNSMIDVIYIDTAFMGYDGFPDSFGPATSSHEEMKVKQYVLREAQQRILLCDSSKSRKSSSCIFVRWSDHDVLMTDQITEQEQHMVKEVRQLICVSDEDYEFLWCDCRDRNAMLTLCLSESLSSFTDCKITRCKHKNQTSRQTVYIRPQESPADPMLFYIGIHHSVVV